MSDSNVSAPSTTDAGQVPAWRERKNLLIAGAVGAAVVVGLGGYFLLSAGGSSGGTGGLVAGAHTKTKVIVVPTTAAATLPAVYKADPYGNPFSPIYPAAPTASPSAALTSGASNGAAGSAVAVQPVVPVPAATTATPTPTTTKTTTKTVTVKLVSIVDANTVTVKLNGGSTFAVNVNEVFGGTFSLASTLPDEHEATFNYGDGSPFSLTVGTTKKFVVTS